MTIAAGLRLPRREGTLGQYPGGREGLESRVQADEFDSESCLLVESEQTCLSQHGHVRSSNLQVGGKNSTKYVLKSDVELSLNQAH